MMSMFLAVHRDELIRRCAAKAAERPSGEGAAPSLESGIPLFIVQLQRTLEAEEGNQPSESLRISGPPGGGDQIISEMGMSATENGSTLLAQGFALEHVVHGYGDLCQAVTDLAFELDAPFTVGEFRTLNRCLDNGIASAVTAFSRQHEASLVAQTQADADAQVETLFHDMRSSLATASYAVAALELGNLPIAGSTGSVLKHSLTRLRAALGGPTVDDLAQGTAR
jgi:hypothetical protein